MASTVFDMLSLKGRVAMVTGAASGMGQAMAEAYAEAGADLLLPVHKNVAGMDATRKYAEKLGCRVVVPQGDMTKIEDIRAVFKRLDKEFGRIDILATLVGPGYRCSAEEIDLDHFNEVVYGLTTARFCSCQEAGLRMLKQGKGSIIAMGSIASMTALGRGNFAYSVGMGAVVEMVRELSTEWSGRGVRVNAILPAQVTNAGFPAFWKANPEIEKKMLSGIPIGRFGQPEDVKGIALLLASDAASWITGVLFPFDGGNLAMNAGGSPGVTKIN
jgi:NAD(P)-dependent dehydrogenase (short-subunit alcohol dehydrogenase family)